MLDFLLPRIQSVWFRKNAHFYIFALVHTFVSAQKFCGCFAWIPSKFCLVTDVSFIIPSLIQNVQLSIRSSAWIGIRKHFVLREVAAQFERPALLFSGGKDSIVVSYLAMKAFYPARVPFPLLHIDTGYNFQETIQFRDYWAEN